jgi:hypothetical protein
MSSIPLKKWLNVAFTNDRKWAVWKNYSTNFKKFKRAKFVLRIDEIQVVLKKFIC